MLTPIESYRADLERPEFRYDRGQEMVVLKLQGLYDDIVNAGARGFLARIATRNSVPVRGLYLWGGVGRGKTYLVDMFYDCLPFKKKKRYHFHRFMSKVHESLRTLRNHRNPLSISADRLAANTRVLCFDEFTVNDIADAMILGGLLEQLMQRGVILVTTSNTRPDDLYQDGLQRDRFMPTIELIKQCTEVVGIESGTDYRLQFLDRADTYFAPLDERAQQGLEFNFRNIAADAGRSGVSLEIQGRTIPTVRHANGVIWFEFSALCGGPRSQTDYLEIARCFHTVLVANISQLSDDANDVARRLINLIDVLYDRHVNLIISAQVGPQDLYIGTALSREFKRTSSRLTEMQSKDYLARRHLA